MSGTVDVFTRTVEDVVAVPIQAVTVRDVARLERDSKDGAEEDGAVADSTNVSTGMGMPEEDLRKVVFIVEDDKAKLVEVETGIADDSHIQIVSGLSGGEQVVVGPYRVVSRTLQPDAAVRTKPMGAAIASSETPN